jgi:hypothetical protein
MANFFNFFSNFFKNIIFLLENQLLDSFFFKICLNIAKILTIKKWVMTAVFVVVA